MEAQRGYKSRGSLPQVRGDAAGEDTILDLIGYLILLRVLHRAEDKNAV